jgi:hypothetical protein
MVPCLENYGNIHGGEQIIFVQSLAELHQEALRLFNSSRILAAFS